MALVSTILTNSALPISDDLASSSAVTVMLFCNYNTPSSVDSALGRQWLEVYAVKDGDSPGTANKLMHRVPLDAGDTFTFSTERIVLDAHDRIHANTLGQGVASVIMGGAGSSYVNGDPIYFSDPDFSEGVTATGYALVTGGAVTGVYITEAGSGYITPPSIDFTQSGNGLATGTAVLSSTSQVTCTTSYVLI
jgi:hypothetical protein